MTTSARDKLRQASTAARDVTLGRLHPTHGELVALSTDASRLVASPERVRRGLSFGINESLRRGHGMEYAESRPWVSGDDVRNMDWRVTARTGKPHTKMFEQERDQPWSMVVDMRGAMAFGTRERFKLVQAARVAALIGWAGTLLGNRLGGVVLSDKGLHSVPISPGRSAVLNFIQSMSSVDVPPEARGQIVPVDPDRIDSCLPVAPEGSAVFVISDFSGWGDETLARLSRLATGRTGVGVRISDPIESTAPPPGRYAMAVSEARQVVGIADEEDQRAWVDAFTQRSQHVHQVLLASGFRIGSVDTNEDPVPTLHRLLVADGLIDTSGESGDT